MKNKRLLFLALIILFGLCMIVFLSRNGTEAPLEMSFAPIFQAVGNTTKNLSTITGRILPVDKMDEKQFGMYLRRYFLMHSGKVNTRQREYANKLFKTLSPFTEKPFEYEIFIYNSGTPNAFALPGGTIFFTSGLFEKMSSESEILAIMAHELGHIEQGHCFNSIKYLLLGKKLNAKILGKIIQTASTVLLRHSYSKTQEDEADEYAFKLLTKTEYDPYGLANAFEALQMTYRRYGIDNKKTDVIRDYFSSHPPLELRIEEFRGKADAWWKRNRSEKRYIGKKNLKNFIPFDEKEYISEWRTN